METPRGAPVMRGSSLSKVREHDQTAEEYAAAQGDIETYYEDGPWKNKREGTDRAFGAGYCTKEDAVAAGRETAGASKVEHIIKNQDGEISEKNSYGNDPRNVPG